MMTTGFLDVYPELAQRITALCRGATWCVTGASALIHDDHAFYFEITKPRHWLEREDGATVVGLGGIGGTLEPGEAVLDCLVREVQEELRSNIQIESARETHLVYEEHTIDTAPLAQRDYPAPILGTVSQNIHRRDALPDCQVLAILTFLAKLISPPVLGDLFGWASLPAEALRAAFAAAEVNAHEFQTIPGIQIVTQGPLPPNAVIQPIWTARSLQVLMQGGVLTHPHQLLRSLP